MNRTDSTRYSLYRIASTGCQFGSFSHILFWNWQQYIFDERPRYELPIDPFQILQDRKTMEKRSPCIVNNNLSLARIDYTFRQKFMVSYKPLFPKLESGRKILRSTKVYRYSSLRPWYNALWFLFHSNWACGWFHLKSLAR